LVEPDVGGTIMKEDEKPKPESSQRKVVTEAALKLAGLVNDPQPGLSTWHEACEKAYQELVKAAREGGSRVVVNGDFAVNVNQAEAPLYIPKPRERVRITFLPQDSWARSKAGAPQIGDMFEISHAGVMECGDLVLCLPYRAWRDHGFQALLCRVEPADESEVRGG
jgi:hypothetical protein